MSELYLSENPFGTAHVESLVDASVKNANVESSGKATKESSKSEAEQVDKETPSERDNPSSGETLEKSKTVAENFAEASKPNVPENVAIPTDATADVVDKPEKKTNSNPDAAQDVEPPTDMTDAAKDVEASKEASSPNAVTATESFGSGSDTEASTEEEVNKNEGTPEDVADSEPENEDVENFGRTTNEYQTMVDLDEIESEEDPQPPPAQKGIGRRLRSRNT
ncbi:hypothetical protein L195_g054414 [Trifolium pratense]|uniref:Uncharacterized protein n=1 Tax=Trifolium pratense TaxID=57577 RepID=A0A2K3KFX0_TRIPR|nr:hypothetical protein L195_g054414 [Trifolium pratense]